MYIALAGLDKWARHDNGDMNHSNKHCYVNDVWYHIWQTVQLAEYALVHEVLLGCEMSIVVDVMRTFITIRCNGTTLRLRVWWKVKASIIGRYTNISSQANRILLLLIIRIIPNFLSRY